jgi:fatty-acyl-CoA synthase
MGWDDRLTSLRTLRRSGVLAPRSPRRLLAAGRAMRHWGPSYAGGFAATAALHPDRPCVIDERGQLTWAEVDERSDALAVALADRGVGEGAVVAMLVRNHRGFVLATAALSKRGATTLYLNTGFAGPQLHEVLTREQPVGLIHDDEFDALLEGDHHGGFTLRTSQLDALIAAGTSTGAAALDAPSQPGRTIILTSGTTGSPKGAPRDQIAGIDPVIAMLDRIPYRSGEVTVLAAPLFHSWGFANLSLGLLLASTFVLRPTFDPEAALADIARHRAAVLVAVPVMLQRILDLPPKVRRRYDTSSLRIVPLSGSAIPEGIAQRWMDEFGDNLYNLYGSTEVGWVTIATPDDLRADPTTAGRPPLHTEVRLLDDHGREVSSGANGRIFVGSELLFEGYTGGGNKEVIDGLMSTGDTGHFDAAGRLYVDGRDDEMIVSGGENVFPREVEDLLSTHPDVREVAVIGVPDDEFGQRLKAFVARRPGASIDAAAVQGFVRENLARFKVPRDVEFVDDLPRNATGKIVKRSLS